MNEASPIEGWSINRAPTPGRLARTSMPNARRSPAGPIPGAQQMSRAVNGAGAEDHLPPAIFHLPPAHGSANAAAHGAIEQQGAHGSVGADRQVRAGTGRAVEIADGGRDTALIPVGDGDREISVLEDAVLVGQVFAARLLERRRNRARMQAPVLAWDAADRDASLLAVQRVVVVEVALHLAEIRQHIGPAPAGGAACFPFIVVGRRAAVGELSVDRRTAAEDARLLVFAQRRPLGGIVVRDRLRADLEFSPVEAGIEIGGAGIAVGDLGRHVIFRGVLAGFAEQDGVAAARRETIGQHRTG